MNILFICTGNSCRSPMAEGYFRHLCMKNSKNAKVMSAGTAACAGDGASANAVRVMSENGIDISSHVCRQISREMIESADMIIAMSSSHVAAIGRILGGVNIGRKVSMLCGIAGSNDNLFDPYGGDMASYRRCFAEIKKALDKLIEYID